MMIMMMMMGKKQYCLNICFIHFLRIYYVEHQTTLIKWNVYHKKLGGKKIEQQYFSIIKKIIFPSNKKNWKAVIQQKKQDNRWNHSHYYCLVYFVGLCVIIYKFNNNSNSKEYERNQLGRDNVDEVQTFN